MKNLTKIITPLIIIFAAAALRLIPHIPNFAPITAMALFGGVYLNKKYALLVPIAAMVASDIFLGFNASTPSVYASFLISGFLGLWLKKHKAPLNIIASSITASVIFYLLTNFNFWYATSLYPKTWSGMIEAYVMAIPFFRNTLLGDLFYTVIFFGSYELILALISKKPLFSFVKNS